VLPRSPACPPPAPPPAREKYAAKLSRLLPSRQLAKSLLPRALACLSRHRENCASRIRQTDRWSHTPLGRWGSEFHVSDLIKGRSSKNLASIITRVFLIWNDHLIFRHGGWCGILSNAVANSKVIPINRFIKWVGIVNSNV